MSSKCAVWILCYFMAYCNHLAPQWQILAERVGLQLHSVIGNSFSDQLSRSSAFDPKFSSQQGKISHRSVELMGWLIAATQMMADWQEEASVTAQDCSAALRERPVRKNPESQYAQTMNALIWNKLCCSLIMHLHMYSQLSFINTKTK